MDISNKFYMAGTEDTGRYVVVLVSGLGRVGYRDLGGGMFRVRIEPAGREAGDKLRPSFPGYKEGTGGSEYRFSTVIRGGLDGLRSVIANAVKALVPGGELAVNPAAPDWAREAVEAARLTGHAPAQSKPDTGTPQETETDERQRLIAEARKLGIRGVSSRWTVETLRRKIAEATPGPTAAEQEARSGETEADERDRLVSEVRARKLPGANSAGRWSLPTLRAKLAAI